MVRLVSVLMSNGLIFVFGVLFFRPGGNPETGTEGIVYVLLGCVLCFWSTLGFAAEILKHRQARRINVVLPAALATLMASTVVWLPPLDRYSSDAGEAATFYFIFASIPAFLAVMNFWVYRRVRQIKTSDGAESRLDHND